MSAIVAQITGVSFVGSTVYSGVDQRNQKLRLTGRFETNSPVTGRYPSQRASNTENDVIVAISSDILNDAIWSTKLKKKVYGQGNLEEDIYELVIRTVLAYGPVLAHLQIQWWRGLVSW